MGMTEETQTLTAPDRRYIKESRLQLSAARDERCKAGEPYSLRSFAWDLLVNGDVDMTNFALRVDAVSRTEQTPFKDASDVGDAVLEVVHTWSDIRYSVYDLDPKLLEATGLDVLRHS